MSATAQSNANFITQITDLADCVGKTPLVKLNRLPEQEQIANGAVLLAKLEGNNPAGSVKDRPAFNMIYQAEQRGDIKPGDMLIEATSGNTGIALAMVAAMRGYPITLFMPTNSTQERKDAMAAYGATLIEVDEGIEASRDMALQMQADGKGIVLDQFNNPDNKQAHYLTTGPELWAQTDGKITHFISSMGTTGTITGVAQYLKEQNPDIKVIGLQPDEEASIAGIRRWPAAYMPGIFEADLVDDIMDVDQRVAEVYMRKLAKTEGIFAGVSSGAAAWAATEVAKANPDAVIAFIVCDRGDRYLSTGLYSVNDADDSTDNATP
ncbi:MULTISPECIES: cysteine synthase CysM [unclassified Psychrobacter]|jgi:cysteine synthase B|uniref:cysteine synthase CysM n=1 Tax=Psychrobacter TaxID=497 RepID=UPI001B11133F|nr:cysteine synthase CysM [Psychrobacter sp. UBA6291]MBO6199901.1 cysteine synthase CysM [Psychrobacter sp.]MBP7942686.1 cysteine synthase CysM [Psychrobacter sp.]MDN5693793.1 cysteine synthase CysM [Psychrobacter sp.]